MAKAGHGAGHHFPLSMSNAPPLPNSAFAGRGDGTAAKLGKVVFRLDSCQRTCTWGAGRAQAAAKTKVFDAPGSKACAARWTGARTRRKALVPQISRTEPWRRKRGTQGFSDIAPTYRASQPGRHDLRLKSRSRSRMRNRLGDVRPHLILLQ